MLQYLSFVTTRWLHHFSATALVVRHGRPPGQLEEPLHAVLVAAGGRQRLFLLLYFVEEGRLGLLLDRVVVAICILVL